MASASPHDGNTEAPRHAGSVAGSDSGFSVPRMAPGALNPRPELATLVGRPVRPPSDRDGIEEKKEALAVNTTKHMSQVAVMLVLAGLATPSGADILAINEIRIV